jgi:KaiC/GvpD/RAD55 family RecA-like ATPase
MRDKDEIRRSRADLEAALRQAGCSSIRGKDAKCPFHEDRTPSGSIHSDEAGVWRFTCHTVGCAFSGDVFDVLAKHTNRKPEDVLREMVGTRPAEAPAVKTYPTVEALAGSVRGLEACYRYANPDTGVVEMVVMRHRDGNGKKHFWQARPHSSGGFVMKAPAKPWPLYNRARVRCSEEVIVVEGEKCVHSLHDLGIVATTSPGGADNGQNADWAPLAGKRVVLWPDNDQAGREHMERVLVQLERLDPRPEVRWIDPADFSLPEKGDVVDFLELYAAGSADDRRGAVKSAVATAFPKGGASDLDRLIEETIAGKRKTIRWPWVNLSRLTRALMPGTVTCVCGDPGSSKSFFMLEAAMYWHARGTKVAVFEAEEDRAYHLNRGLAQLEENANLVDSDWVEANPDEAKRARDAHRAAVDAFAPSMDAAPDDAITYTSLLEWLERRSAAGARVAVIDPITAVATTDKPWQDDRDFLFRAKSIVRKYGNSLVLVTHPRKGKKGVGSMDDLAGGAAFPRFCQAVFWIVRHDQPKVVRCHGPVGAFETGINRTVKVVKARNGAGAGLDIGFYFDGKSLRFGEQGVIVPGKPGEAAVSQPTTEPEAA